MRAHRLVGFGLCSLPLLACSDAAPGPVGPQVSIDVAPLTLPGIEEACFGIVVTNDDPNGEGTPDTVWSNNNVCSTQYGNSLGDITYIGPCDASVSPTHNFVALTLNSLADSTGDLTDPDDFVNPCPPGDPCILDFECQENADVLVEFNLTVMRSARQGFFDIAVNFDDIFCSAKLDSCYEVGYVTSTVTVQGTNYTGYQYVGNGQTITAYYSAIRKGWVLLNDQGVEIGVVNADQSALPPSKLRFGEFSYDIKVTGSPMNLLFGDTGREWTAVAALSCTAGTGNDTNGTSLVFAGPSVVCDGGVKFDINLSAEDGGKNTITWSDEVNSYDLSFATYQGSEDLLCDGQPCNKVYYNIAFNLQALADQGLTNCRLVYAATAVETPAEGYDNTTTFDASGALSDPNGVYPGILFGGQNGALLLGTAPSCYAHPLNGTGSAVRTGYLQGAAFSGSNASVFQALYHFDGSTTGSFIQPQ